MKLSDLVTNGDNTLSVTKITFIITAIVGIIKFGMGILSAQDLAIVLAASGGVYGLKSTALANINKGKEE